MVSTDVKTYKSTVIGPVARRLRLFDSFPTPRDDYLTLLMLSAVGSCMTLLAYLAGALGCSTLDAAQRKCTKNYGVCGNARRLISDREKALTSRKGTYILSYSTKAFLDLDSREPFLNLEMEKIEPKAECPYGVNNVQQPAPGDWVKELFSPIFDFDAIIEAGKHVSNLDKPHIKRASILEPQAVREVFERVHQRVVESEKLKEEELAEKKQKEDDRKIDPRQSSIWETEELDTLRKVYKSAKGEISRLEAELRASNNHKSCLEAELKAEREKTNTLTSRLGEAVKANQRLVIHRDNLQQQNAVMEVKVAALTDMWHEIDVLKQKAMESETAVKQQLDSQRLQRQKLEFDLAQLQQNAERDKELVVRDVQTRFEIEINDLQDVVKDLTLELQKEKQQHEASKRGLDHLRLHFSSLPLQDVLPPGMVDEDQVGRIDHCDSS